jgi:hypothetical protein
MIDPFKLGCMLWELFYLIVRDLRLEEVKKELSSEMVCLFYYSLS